MATAVKVLDRPDPTALGAIYSSELDHQIEVARRYPRDEGKALKTLADLALRSDAAAESCMYTLVRSEFDKETGKKRPVYITGPSIRFAETLAYCWGNMRWAGRIIEEAEFHIVAQGVAYDLQRNNGVMIDLRRGIKTSTGHRFGADMVNVVSNAAISIAQRNVIFDCIPKLVWTDTYEDVKQKAIGAQQIPERIQAAIKYFVGKGAKVEDILSALAVKSVEEMGREHLEVFLGLKTAIKEGPIDIAKIFTAEGAEERAKLSLVAEEEDQFNSIDKQVAPKEGGADPKASAASAPGSSQRSDRGKGKAGKAKGDSAAADKTAAPKGDGQPEESGQSGAPATETKAEPSTGETDADLVARVVAEEKALKGPAKGKAIKTARSRLQEIAKGKDTALAAQADELLDRYDLDEPPPEAA
jgi:hypothetical protein